MITETFDTQVIYKLGVIESQVKSLGENLTAAVGRLEDKMDESTQHNDKRLEELSNRVSKNEDRLNSLDQWKNNQINRIAAVIAVMSLFWLIFGAVLQEKIGTIF